MREIMVLFSSAKLIDVIDITVIAVFIYIILIWFAQARARFVMIGLFILGSVYILARIFGLYLTTAVFQAFFAFFLITVVIIFQDEFRRFFERLAVFGLIRNKKRFTSFNKNVDMLTNALVNLVNKKIGALVIVKGKEPLERHMESGIPLGGIISQIMLETIFDPHVPSHDGAVIIEEDRIIEFGAHLPLSMNIHEIGHLGTRHAAALGLSERSDALCLVVSEERGVISIAEGGKIKRLDDIAALRLRLEDFYRKKFPQKRKLWSEVLTGHIVEKIIAALLACGLWFAFGHQQEIIRRDLVIPIEYRNLAADWIIAEPKPKEATVSLSGSESAFNLMNTKELTISLDMSKVKEGDNEFSLTKDSVRGPADVAIINITPAKIDLEAYRLVNLSVPVEALTSGRPPTNIAINSIKVEPQVISVAVASTFKKDGIKLTTENIDLGKISESTVLSVKLVIPPQVHLLDEKYQEVRVAIEVEKNN